VGIVIHGEEIRMNWTAVYEKIHKHIAYVNPLAYRLLQIPNW